MDKDVSTIDVDLELSKPYDLHQLFQTDESKKFGVYLWTIKHEEQYLVHYVGETGTSFAQRTNEHIKCLLNGHYCINDPEKLANGVRVKLWEGWWKRRKNPEFTEPSRIVEFLDRYDELSRAAYESIKPLWFFLLPFDPKFKDDKRTRLRVETAIAKATRSDLQDEYMFESSYKLGESHNGEPVIRVSIKGAEKIIGLPSKVEVKSD